ncbi:MAG: exodeoxyribonuclease VII large subunit [Firmicutes bacterium]|nr:exodeoxyribonuclease VII large subunit [Bacillota bacterium]MCL2255684.1 exodeoxyribonuclease VII large subunit [Bacillota bacterium]
MTKNLTVSQLNSFIKGVFVDEYILHDIWVSGEVREFKVSGNSVYLTLCENECVLSCVKFSLIERIEVGTKIMLRGGVNFFEKGGRVTFVVKEVKIEGEGENALKLKKLKEKLKNEGLFEKGKKLPKFIKKVCVITGAAGIVIHDILSVLKNFPIELFVFPVKIQGEGASEDIIRALMAVESGVFDCVLITRGGGSAIDLDVFNCEKLSRLVANYSLPVISAIGHEVDFTLVDLCSRTRCATPSLAAQIILDTYLSNLSEIQHFKEKISILIMRLYEKKSFALKSLSNEITYAGEKKISHYVRKITMNAQAMTNIMESKLKQDEQKIVNVAEVLEQVSPLKLLKRGFVKVEKNGKTIVNLNDVKKNDIIDVILHDGTLNAEIKKIEVR